MLLTLLFISGMVGNTRLVKYFADEQAVKASVQITRDYNEVEFVFTGKKRTFDEIFQHGNEMNIFQYKIGRELVASVFLANDMFHGLEKDTGDILNSRVVGIYSLYVAKEYRRHGYSKRLLADALSALDTHYGMKGDFLLVLHMDPKDADMELAFSLYYNLNFRNGGFSMRDPFSKRYTLEEILDYGNAFDAINDYKALSDRERYMILCCRYSSFGMCGSKRVSYEEALRYGTRLRGILEQNRNN